MKRAIISSGDLHNVGDLALLLQCAHGLRDMVGIQDILVRQWASMDAGIREQLVERRIELLAGKRLVAAALKSVRALTIIGGGQMARDNASLKSLSALNAMMRISNATGGASAVIGCGVSDLKQPRHAKLWRGMLRRAALVTTRDETSRRNAAGIAGPGVRVDLTADLAFLPSPLHDALQAQADGAPAVVVAPCMDASEHRRVDVSALAGAVGALADALETRRIVIVAHDARAGMDPLVCAQTQAAIRAARPDLDVSIVASFRLDDVVRVYRSAAVVVTNRLHAMIFALIAGKPVLALDDGGAKTADAARRFDAPSLPVDGAISTETIGRIARERVSGPSENRRGALAEAMRLSALNFTALRAALGGAKPDV